MTRWWMSFCDSERPAGEQFLGVCIVEAVDENTATKAAWALGINPGGEIRFMDINEDKAASLSFDLSEYQDQFIAADEAKVLADRIARELGS